MDETDSGETEGTCETCGATTELRFGERWICEACYVAAGACCAGDDED